ncbi:MAG: molybdopterin converting factor subunit 1 [Pseudomonadota bacterium]
MARAPVKLLYFAWVREAVGLGEELVDLPASSRTVADVVLWLRSRGPHYERAFAAGDVIRVACDHTYADLDAPIADVREIAFFPPVTGG